MTDQPSPSEPEKPGPEQHLSILNRESIETMAAHMTPLKKWSRMNKEERAEYRRLHPVPWRQQPRKPRTVVDSIGSFENEPMDDAPAWVRREIAIANKRGYPSKGLRKWLAITWPRALIFWPCDFEVMDSLDKRREKR